MCLRFSIFFPNFGNLTKECCRRYLETVISVNTFIVGFTVFCLLDFFIFRVTPLFTSFCRTDDIERINNTIQRWETMGKIPARGFITKLYSATGLTVSKYGKNMLTVNRPVRLHFLWVISFTNGIWIWIFLRAFYTQQCKRYTSLFLALKDNNDLSLCSFTNFSPQTPPPPSVGSKLM